MWLAVLLGNLNICRPTKPIQTGELDKILKEDSVLYVLLHGSDSVLVCSAVVATLTD